MILALRILSDRRSSDASYQCKSRRQLVRCVTLPAGLEHTGFSPSVPRLRAWPLVGGCGLSRREVRNSRSVPPARSTDAAPSGKPTAGPFFFVPAATAPTLDPSPFPACHRDHLPFADSPSGRPFATVRAFSTQGRGITVLPSWTSALASPSSPSGRSFDTSLSVAVSRGHCRLVTTSAPFRRSAPLLPRRGPPGFRSLPKRLATTRFASEEIFFGSPRKKRSLAWGAGTTCFMVPREKAGQKRRKNPCIKTAFPSSASSVTTHN